LKIKAVFKLESNNFTANHTFEIWAFPFLYKLEIDKDESNKTRRPPVFMLISFARLFFASSFSHFNANEHFRAFLVLCQCWGGFALYKVCDFYVDFHYLNLLFFPTNSLLFWAQLILVAVFVTLS